ncbi:hypothetical protein ACLOJK_000047 [Asimina triloba]
MGQVKVIGHPYSFFCWRVACALKIKGVDFEYLIEEPGKKSPLLLEHNPVYKLVPVLLHGGNPICESLVILEYIDETWKELNPILPQDPYERASARFWAKFVDDKAWAAFSLQGEDREKAIDTALETLKVLEEQVEVKKLVGGEAIGHLDIAMGLIAFWLPVWEEATGTKLLKEETFPCLHAWAENFANHPLIKETLPPRDEMLEAFKKKFSGS